MIECVGGDTRPTGEYQGGQGHPGVVDFNERTEIWRAFREPYLKLVYEILLPRNARCEGEV